jgi:hypothetical protein
METLETSVPSSPPLEAIVASKKEQEPLTLAIPLATTSTNDAPEEATEAVVSALFNWHGAPRFTSSPTTPGVHEEQTTTILLQQPESPRAFRARVRQGLFTGPTNAICPGFLQCNLVVLPANTIEAFEFLLFCQRNPQACPLIEVCCTGKESSTCPVALAPGSDLRTDCPKYVAFYGMIALFFN